MAKRSSDPRVAYPETNVQARDLVHAVGIVASLAPWDSVFGEIHFIEPQGLNGPGTTTSSRPRESQAKFRDGTVWGL